MNKLIKKIRLREFSDSRGQLLTTEFFLEHALTAKRVYILKNVPNFAQRGGHAHKELRQIFFCLQGSFRITVTDGVTSELFVMSHGDDGILLESGLWRDLNHFSQDAICLVIASEPYDADDYISNFEDFLLWQRQR